MTELVSRRASLRSWTANSTLVGRFLKNTTGSTAIEYGLIMGLVFLAIVTAIHYMTGQTAAMYTYIGSKLVSSSS